MLGGSEKDFFFFKRHGEREFTLSPRVLLCQDLEHGSEAAILSVTMKTVLGRVQ